MKYSKGFIVLIGWLLISSSVTIILIAAAIALRSASATEHAVTAFVATVSIALIAFIFSACFWVFVVDNEELEEAVNENHRVNRRPEDAHCSVEIEPIV